ncbi:growth-regulating factor 4-like isoform X2 [Salvia miltiorrhiza]|uniref:growth-regulating factor 4-like isoform X2 n=1 Tax=Salvia miltiorrhiza TaxID=226208 RepID=UPI0025ABABA1|nr:growth-regulating factor 4-like isoform X2 [Salvia miltiorrhiza]XP_057766624.1 growth-regulating factor 4-like isoform X2 [Salvia miltiorrhiza]XP_057766625.1 growth-regulating factor 4-like isoform X2 [Salvia miltiorrhiza]XP_057766626.1 growth-regulating factor 4-like isoform X2 [Salvia miltiorrhiza]XP_057766627.1 growth-regulating factor 4-like isoform X2 [Salvia miltiorrhiza]
MSEKAPITVVGIGAELGYGGYRAPPFTDVQWKELEQQAMIYKYMVAGLPVPPDLVTPIRHSFEGLYAHLFNHPALGYCSYYGKKFDPEPGRCRRTDGKKWRCSKDAHPDSKYCERHMHRGRNRSRKPVESQSTSQSVLTAVPHSSTGGGINRGSSQQMPLYSGANADVSSVASNATKLQMGPISYGIGSSREFSFSQEGSGRVGTLGLGPSAGSGTWGLMPSQVSSNSLFKQGSDSRILGSSSAQQYTPHAYEPVSSKQQHGLFGSDISSPTTLKQEHLFFSEWPSTKESWSNLDNDGTNENTFSSTQLSMSTPRASSDFTSGTAYSPNDG